MSTSAHHAKCLQRDLCAARVRIAQLERRVEQSDITDDERLDEIASGQADLVKAGREMLNLCNKLELCQARIAPGSGYDFDELVKYSEELKAQTIQDEECIEMLEEEIAGLRAEHINGPLKG